MGSVQSALHVKGCYPRNKLTFDFFDRTGAVLPRPQNGPLHAFRRSAHPSPKRRSNSSPCSARCSRGCRSSRSLLAIRLSSMSRCTERSLIGCYGLDALIGALLWDPVQAGPLVLRVHAAPFTAGGSGFIAQSTTASTKTLADAFEAQSFGERLDGLVPAVLRPSGREL